MTALLINQKWRDRFLKLADHVATWSKDPSTQVGAVIVDPETKNVVSFGYNGFPRGVSDASYRYDDREIKYKLVVHAEVNAIIQAKGNTEGKWLFINVPSCCNECMKLVVQSGISTIVMPKWNASDFAARWMNQDKWANIMRSEAGIARVLE